MIQKHVKTWIAKIKYKKLKYACVVIQKNVRRFISLKKYIRFCRATLTIQSYFRGWTARRKYEAMMQQIAMRPYSRQSLVSMSSLGYYSLTASASIYSLNPSLHDVSPCDATLGNMGTAGFSGEALKAYLSPEHHQRLLETEESGIETDTESINEDADQVRIRRSRKLRRRTQLQELLRGRNPAKIPRIPSDESVVDVPDKPFSQNLRLENSSCKPDSISKHSTSCEGSCKHNSTVKKVFPCKFSKNFKNSSDEKTGKEKSESYRSSQKIRVATMRNLQEVSGILQGYSPSENLQMVLPKQNLSLFFKDGVLSYRRMPVVCIHVVIT